jgi:Neutral/alkaline non-lysosomal ceramidase, N-terminal
MRLWLRVGLRMMLAAGLLMAAVALLGLAGIDTRPYQQSVYFRVTERRLRELVGQTNVVMAMLQAGFGAAKLTPDLDVAVDAPGRGEFKSLPLAGYGQRDGTSATGVHDDLWVKAVAFAAGSSTCVVISAEALVIPREVAESATRQLRENTGLDRAQVYLGATHTHCGLGGWAEGMVGEAFAGGFRPGVRVWFAQQLVCAAQQALADLRPAKMGSGSFAAPEFVRNRLVGEQGEVNDQFTFLTLRQDDGNRAVIGSYSAHATVLPASFTRFSGDYPGCWQRAVEKASGAMAVFLAGAVGSHGPRAPAGGFEGAQRVGESLAQAVLERLPSTPLTNRVAFGIVGLEVDLPDVQARIADSIRLRPYLASHLIPSGKTTFLQAFRLGEQVWLSTPCDFSGELALGIQEAVRRTDLSAVVTSFNGDYLGYVIPAKCYHLDRYESRTMSFFGPQLPDYFDTLLRGLARSLVTDK